LQSLVEKISEDTAAASWALLTFEKGDLHLRIQGNQPQDVHIPLPIPAPHP
jgi:hypothetical protein